MWDSGCESKHESSIAPISSLPISADLIPGQGHTQALKSNYPSSSPCCKKSIQDGMAVFLVLKGNIKQWIFAGKQVDWFSVFFKKMKLIYIEV